MEQPRRKLPLRLLTLRPQRHRKQWRRRLYSLSDLSKEARLDCKQHHALAERVGKLEDCCSRR